MLATNQKTHFKSSAEYSTMFCPMRTPTKQQVWKVTQILHKVQILIDEVNRYKQFHEEFVKTYVCMECAFGNMSMSTKWKEVFCTLWTRYCMNCKITTWTWTSVQNGNKCSVLFECGTVWTAKLQLLQWLWRNILIHVLCTAQCSFQCEHQ